MFVSIMDTQQMKTLQEQWHLETSWFRKLEKEKGEKRKRLVLKGFLESKLH